MPPPPRCHEGRVRTVVSGGDGGLAGCGPRARGGARSAVREGTMARNAKTVGLPEPRRQDVGGGDCRPTLQAILQHRRRWAAERPTALERRADPLDAAQEREEEMVWVAILARSRDFRDQADEARHRLAAGRYGLCADCGEAIPVARLQALPFAVRCLPCQERYEGGREADQALRSSAR